MDTIMISESQAASLRLSRSGLMAEYDAKNLRRQVWTAIKIEHGLPANERFSVQIADKDHPEYRIVKRKDDRQPVAEPRSRVRYGCVNMAHLRHYLIDMFPDPRSVPAGAKPVGDGSYFYEADHLYFPLD
jgi:hypothetical protein